MQSGAIFYEEVSQRWRQWQQLRSMYPLFIINYSNLPFLFVFTKLMVDFPRKSCLSCTSGGESLVLMNFPGRWGYWEGDESETNTHTQKKPHKFCSCWQTAASYKIITSWNHQLFTTLLFVEEAREPNTGRVRELLFYFLSFMSLQSWCIFSFWRFSVNILS